MSEPEIYPMPAFPTLSVSNLAVSKQFYVDGLGFQVIFSMPPGGGPAVLEHLRWARYADLLLEQGPESEGEEDRVGRGSGVRLNFSATLAGRTCADIAERARAHGGGTVRGPVERPYNAREVVVTVGSINLIYQFWVHTVSKPFDEVLTDIQGASG